MEHHLKARRPTRATMLSFKGFGCDSSRKGAVRLSEEGETTEYIEER